jgi:competence protein ComEA
MWRFALLGAVVALFAGSSEFRLQADGLDLQAIRLKAELRTLYAGGKWVRSAAVPDRPLPDGPGKEATQKLCSQCHDMDKSVSVSQDRAGWRRTIEKMLAFGAKATDREFNAVLNYLATNFPADDVPKINVNKARAIEFESGLSLRRSQAAAIIRYREKHGPFKSIEDLKKVPGVDGEKIEAKKDRLIF